MKFINIKGDLFAATACFALTGIIKLASSMFLTRILYPQAYGIVTTLASVVFTLEMLSDVGVVGFIIRDKKAEQRSYLDTLWTIRFCRGWINFAALYVSAPLLAQWYETPALTDSLRVFSLWFVLHGIESLSFPLAIRNQRARIASYADLTCTVASTLFVVSYSFYHRNHDGMIYGMVLHRLLMTLISYRVKPQVYPRLAFDRQAAKDLFGFSRFVLPSSFITLFLTQFDKLIFLKLFNLELLGLYGIAANVASMIDGLTSQISRNVLLARCAVVARDDRDSLRTRFYRDNVKLFMMIMAPPALVGGAAHFIVGALYDPRYAYAAFILQAFMLRSMLLSQSMPAENLLVAITGGQVVLLGNVCRLGFLLPAVLGGYYFFGFDGFLFGVVLSELAALAYFWRQQHRQALFSLRFESMKLLPRNPSWKDLRRLAEVTQ